MNELKRNNVGINSLVYISCILVSMFITLSEVNYPFTALTLLILSFIFVMLYKREYRIKVDNYFIFAIAIVIWTSLGVMYSPDSSEAIRLMMRFFFCLMLGSAIRYRKEYHTAFLRVFYFFGVLVGLSVIFQFVLPDQAHSIFSMLLKTSAYNSVIRVFRYLKAYSGICGYSNITAYVISITCACFLVLFLKENTVKKSTKLKWLFLYFICLFLLVLTSKRSIFVITIIASILLFLIMRYDEMKRNRVVLAVTLIVLFTVAYVLLENNTYFTTFINRFSLDTNSDFTTGRSLILANSYQIIKNSWLIGNGSGSAEYLYTSNYYSLSGGLHNIYVQIVFENGIIGLVLWGAFFVNNMKRVIRAIKIHGNIQLYLSFFVQVLFLLYGLFGNPLYDEPQLCSYCIFSAISYGYSEEYQKMEYKAQ